LRRAGEGILPEGVAGIFHQFIHTSFKRSEIDGHQGIERFQIRIQLTIDAIHSPELGAELRWRFFVFGGS
jgi:hypothetical protein